MRDRPLLARLCSVLVLLLGVEVALLVFMAIGSTVVGIFSRNVSHYTYQDIEVTVDGQVFVSTSSGDGSAPTLTDAAGKPITDERFLTNNTGELFCRFTPLFSNFKADRTLQASSLAGRPRDLNNYASIANANGNEGAENWYVLVQQNIFVGYDKLSHRQIGMCDLNGFHESAATPKPFSERLYSQNFWDTEPHLYSVGNQLYGLDFVDRKMTTFLSAQGAAIYGFNHVRPSYRKALYIAVGLEKELRILDLKGTPLFTVPYAHNPATWESISVTTVPTGDRVYFLYVPPIWAKNLQRAKAVPPTFVEEVDLHGNSIHSYSFPTRGFFHEQSWRDHAAVCAVPPLVAGLVWIARSQANDSPYTDSISVTPLDSPVDVAVLLILSGALGIAAFLWARRIGLSTASAVRWMFFVWLFGLPGFLTFRLGIDWPTRVPCPKCSRRRSIAVEECEECRQAWPAPEPTGTEIFQPVAH